MSSWSEAAPVAGASAPPHARRSELGAGRLAAFSMIAMPVAAAQIPLNIYLPPIFAQHFGIPLSTLGLIFLVEKIWGAFSDPLIGVLSDRTSSRFGRRRIWIGGGGLLFGLAGLLLFFPPATLTPLYLGLALFAFYLSWSMVQIPYFAWSAEVSGDYDERTRVATYQAVAGATAALLVLVLPTIVDQVAPGNGRLKLGVMGGLLLSLLALALPLTLNAFKDARTRTAQASRRPFAETVRVVFGNPLLVRVLASDFAVTLGQSIRGALFVFFVSAYMGLPHWASGLFLVQFVFGVVAGPIWMKVGYRLGKHRAAVTAELVQVAINLGLLFVAPGQLPLLLGLTVAQGLAQGSGNLMLRSMVADVADEDRLRSGEDRTALFFSVFSISTKAAMAAAVGIALPLVAWLGFDPKAAANTPEALRGLAAVFALGPALAHVVSAALVNGFPLDAQAHGEIRRQLAQRERAPFPTPAE